MRLGIVLASGGRLSTTMLLAASKMEKKEENDEEAEIRLLRNGESEIIPENVDEGIDYVETRHERHAMKSPP